MKRRLLTALLSMVLISVFLLAGLQRLLVPKYMGQVVEGAFIQEYYNETTDHDVIFLGDCEVYENISPVILFREFGITSYIRGSAQQMISQSYYLLEETLKRETPKVVVFNVSAMQQYEQTNETYNRMTLDGMRWSSSKWNAILASAMEDEHMIEYLFPILRFHSRWNQLEEDDFRYYFRKNQVSHNGYYMRADIRPAEDFPAVRRLADYSFDERAWEYLEKMRMLCQNKGITFILMKAPSLYPAWHEQWEEQIVSYAEEHSLTYVNCIDAIDEIGIDFTHDTYDGGLHMNVYGAEKMSRYLGPVLIAGGAEDRRDDAGLSAVWKEKGMYYDNMKTAQEEEFARSGYLKQFKNEE